MLSGSWRESPAPLDAPWLAEIEPLVTATGAAGLAWRRVERSPETRTETASVLRNAYRRQRLFGRLCEQEIVRSFTLLRERGIEPLLVKGWALARLYGDPGLRPSGDVDLCVHPDQHAAAEGVLRAADPGTVPVELNAGYPKLLDRSFEDVYARSVLVDLAGTPIRVPAPEEHLRLLCMHLLAHGAWRPIWLCEIAVVVEREKEALDWDRCLARRAVYSDWVACTVGLAHGLLEADIRGTPVADRAARLPRWLAPAVLRQWAVGSGASRRGTVLPALRQCWREPGRLAEELRSRWRNPIQASVELHAPFNDMPRLPLQIAAAFGRVPSVARQIRAAIPSDKR